MISKWKVLALCLFVTACGNANSNDSPPSTPTVQPTGTDNWRSVAEHLTCEALNPSFCAGYWGFSVDSSGHWIAGPDSSGNKIEGQVTPDELNGLDGIATPMSTSPMSQAIQCDPSVRSIPGSSDVVTLYPGAAGSVTVYQRPMPGSTMGVCYRLGADNANKLHDYFFILLKKYYPSPFPNG